MLHTNVAAASKIFFHNRSHYGVEEGRISTTKQGGPGAPTTVVNEIMNNTAAIIVREDRLIAVDGTAYTVLHDY